MFQTEDAAIIAFRKDTVCLENTYAMIYEWL